MNTNRLSGKNILITGASQGLGRELALEFARHRAAALALMARRREPLEAIREKISHLYPQTRIVLVEADVSRPKDVERTVATALHEFGGQLDVLVNNASTIGPSPMPYLLDFSLDDFQAVLHTNLVGPFLMIRHALPAIIDRGGSIINVTSDAGAVGYAGWGAYGISKFGLEGLSQTWAAELKESGVRVNWVDPGSLNTSMHRAAEPEEDPSQWADPAEVTDVFVYLASDEAKAVTGKRLRAQEDWREELTSVAPPDEK